MGQDRLPPDWQIADERVLERAYAGDDVGAAQAALVELRRRFDNELCAQAHRQSGGNAEAREEALAELVGRAQADLSAGANAQGRIL